MPAFEQLCEIVVPETDMTIGDALDLAHAGHEPAVELLAKSGISYSGGKLQLEIHNPALGHLLLSPLRREPGAVVDLAHGVLSIPLSVEVMR